MNTADYWPMVMEYLVWNAAVANLQFWTADLETHTFTSTINKLFNTFFYSTSTHLLHQQSDEILFSCFVTTLNAAFEGKVASGDEGYKSGSENFNIPTPLQKHPGSTTFPASKMPLSSQFQLHHAVSEIHDSDLYAED